MPQLSLPPLAIKPLPKLLSILCLTLLMVFSSVGFGWALGQNHGHKHGQGLGNKSSKRYERQANRYSGRHPKPFYRYRLGRRYRYNGSTWILVNPPTIIKIQKLSGIVIGQVTFVEGNMMPSPDGPKAGGRPVRRQIGIFRLTSFRQTKPGVRTGFFAAMGSRPLLTTWSAKDGTYRLRLKPGTYTVCVREGGQWYANLSDHLGQINPVLVQHDSTTHHDLMINYKAIY